MSIPDPKLTGFGTSERTIWSNINFRLDMQGMASGYPRMHNLQIQINRGTRITTIKKLAPETVAHTLVEEKGPPSPAEIRSKLLAAIKL